MIDEVLRALGVLALVFAPGLFFVGLMRFIDYIADDELVARVQNGELQSGSPVGRDGGSSADGSHRVDPPAEERVRCQTCGAANWDGATFCQNCLRRVS